MRSWVGSPLFSKTTPHRQPAISVVQVIFSPSQPLNRKRAKTRISQREKVSESSSKVNTENSLSKWVERLSMFPVSPSDLSGMGISLTEMYSRSRYAMESSPAPPLLCPPLAS